MFLFALALLILLPVASNATVSRYLGLGGPGTDYIVYDAANPTIYPSLTTKWIKLFGVEYAGEGSAWNETLVYGVWDFNDGKCAIKFILDSSPTATFNVDELFLHPTTDLPLFGGNYHQLNLQWARNLEKMSIGLGLRLEGKAYKTDDLDLSNDPVINDKLEASYSSFGATFGVTALEKKLDAALAVDFAGFSRDVAGVTEAENDGSMAFSVQARYWHKYSDECTLVPHFRFLSKKLGVSFPGETAETYSETTTDFLLGVGHNWRPVENCLMVFELGVQSYGITYKDEYGSESTEETDSRFDIYWRAGGETKITSWLWGRAGAVRQWRGMTDEETQWQNTDVVKTTTSYTATDIYVGGTAHWQRLHMDFIVQPDFLKYGPAFIGGDNPAGSGLTSRLSLRYQLDEGSWTK
jgi:hypothetical protein